MFGGAIASAAKVMFVVMAVFFVLSIVEGHPVFLFYGVLGLAGAGYLYAATKDQRAASR